MKEKQKSPPDRGALCLLCLNLPKREKLRISVPIILLYVRIYISLAGLLPHKLSQYGPSIAIGDVDNNGLDDIFIGASASSTASLFLQQQGKKFIQKQLESYTGKDIRRPEMMGVLLFDADGDNDLDLYACSGSNEFAPNSKNY